MHWFTLALIGPLLYAAANHIDKILLTRYFKNGGVGTLMLFSSLLSGMVLPFLFLADHSVLRVSHTDMFVLACVGMFNVAILWFYFLALKDDEASVVVIFYQLVPVFGYILGYFILGEVLSTIQLLAMTIIILGATLVSFEVDVESGFRVRKKTLFYMLFASFFWALSSVVFKAVALEENVIRSLFWEHVSLTLFGIFLFCCVPSYRNNFLHAIKSNTRRVVGLNFINEIVYISGTIVFSFTYLLAPVALVLLTNSFQSFFVLAIGIILTLFFPKISVEKIHAKHLWQKFLAICITAIGTYILLTT